jgi:putative membrane protein insertion efficiency factor
VIARFMLLLIRAYQLILSPLLGPSCRFEPSCSRYAAACIAEHGALRGGWLSIRRISRCHPFHPGGYDPPPLRGRSAAASAPHRS